MLRPSNLFSELLVFGAIFDTFWHTKAKYYEIPCENLILILTAYLQLPVLEFARQVYQSFVNDYKTMSLETIFGQRLAGHNGF